MYVYIFIFFLGGVGGGGAEGEFLRKANILSKMSLNLVFTCIVWVYCILNELCRYVSV